jgi:tight adherence protein B
LVNYLESRELESKTQQVSELLFAACLLTFFVVWLLAQQLVLAAISPFLVLLFLSSQVQKQMEKRERTLREQLPDALICLGFCFQAGCSLQQALEQTANETAMPLRRELALTSDDLTSGLAVREALAALGARNTVAEINLLVVALEIQHQTGGSLKDLLESAAESVRTAINLKQQLQIQTAQARLSYKIVAMMPLALMAVLSLTMEGYLSTFFSSLAGLMILLVAGAMELTGIVLIKRILGVDIG